MNAIGQLRGDIENHFTNEEDIMIGIVPLFLALTTGSTSFEDPIVYNYRSVVDRDWWSCTSNGNGDKTFRVLSLRPRDVWGKGTAWLIEVKTQSVTTGFSSAYQGVYEIFKDKVEDEMLVINLGLTRRFDGRCVGDRINWTLSSSYRENPLGMQLELPIPDESLRNKAATFLIARTYYVNSAGDRTVRHYATGFFSTAEETVHHVGPFNEGETLELTDIGFDETQDRVRVGHLLEDYPPLGFKLRDNVRPPLVLAKEATGEGNATRALQILETILSTDPKNLAAIRERGMAYFRLENADLAIADLTQSLNANRHDLVALASRAVCYESKGKLDEALHDLDWAIIFDSQPWLVKKRAYLQLKRKDFKASRADFERVIELQPDDLSPKNNLAWMLATYPDSGMRDGREAYRLAAEVYNNGGRHNWLFVDTLAAAYAELGDFPHAVEYQKAAIKLVPAKDKSDAEQRLSVYYTSQPWRMKPYQ